MYKTQHKAHDLPLPPPITCLSQKRFFMQHHTIISYATSCNNLHWPCKNEKGELAMLQSSGSQRGKARGQIQICAGGLKHNTSDNLVTSYECLAFAAAFLLFLSSCLSLDIPGIEILTMPTCVGTQQKREVKHKNSSKYAKTLSSKLRVLGCCSSFSATSV